MMDVEHAAGGVTTRHIVDVHEGVRAALVQGCSNTATRSTTVYGVR